MPDGDIFDGAALLEGERLDVFAAGLAGVTRSRAGALIREGRATVDGEVQAKPGFRLKPGMAVRLTVPPPAPAAAQAEDIDLDIVYQDDDLAVVFKPSGMVVHPAAGNESGTLVNALLAKLDNLSGIGGERRPGIVHRIDKDGPSSSAACATTRARWRAPSGGTRWTASAWPSCRTAARPPPTGPCWSGCAARR